MALFCWFAHFSNSRAEIVKFFRWYFGRNDGTKRTFWNKLTFRSWQISVYLFVNYLVQIWFFTTSQRFWPYYKPLLLWVPIWENLAYHCLLAKSMVVLMLELSCIRVFLGELSFWLSVDNWLFELKKVK